MHAEDIPSKMRAVVTHGPGDCRYELVDTPRAGPGELIVRVEACGICAGDIKAYKGGEVFWGGNGRPPYLEVPAIGGHELVGRIVELGPDMDSKPSFNTGDREFGLGDRVTVEQIVPCGTCRYCGTGRYSLCMKHDVFGFKNYLNGGFAEYARLPANAIVYKVPDHVPVDSAVLIEPYSCSMHAVERARISADDIVIISGAGPLGLGMIAAAARLKPASLIALDLQDHRLVKARQFGCDLAMNPLKVDVPERIAALTDGYGCDVYIEATGHPSSVNQGLELIRKAGRFVEFSLFNEPVTCNWSVVGDGKELDILGVSLSPFCYSKVIDGMADGSLVTGGVVTHKYPLDQYLEAFAVSMEGKEAIKVVLTAQQ